MSDTTAIRAARADARRALLDMLDNLEMAGHRPPCWSVPVPERAVWTSDDPDDQAAAARACGPCPAITACAAYGLAHPRESGVHGGLTERDRRAAARGKGAA